MGKRILIVGGGGFIGHHLVKNLSIDNEVFIVDNFMVNNLIYHLFEEKYVDLLIQRIDVLKKNCIKVYKDDARDYHKLSLDVDDCKPDVIIHLAAVAHANVSNKNPYLTFDHSLKTLENSLDVARSRNIEKFIYFSSSMVYGDFKKEFASETDLLNPKGIYGTLKFCGEMMVKSYNQVFDVPYIIIRPSALYGPRCVSRRVIQIFIENAMEGKDLVIDGDGEEKIDFTFIDDLVKGMRLVIESKVVNECFNLTYGIGRSINDVINEIKKYFKVIVKYQERDKLVPFRGGLSIEKAKNLFGYSPQFPIEKGIDRYVKWYNGR